MIAFDAGDWWPGDGSIPKLLLQRRQYRIMAPISPRLRKIWPVGSLGPSFQLAVSLQRRIDIDQNKSNLHSGPGPTVNGWSPFALETPGTTTD